MGAKMSRVHVHSSNASTPNDRYIDENGKADSEAIPSSHRLILQEESFGRAVGDLDGTVALNSGRRISDGMQSGVVDYEGRDRRHCVEERTFENNYDLVGKIGSGGYSVVYRCQKKETGETYAVKTVNKAKLSDADRSALAKEIAILHEMEHPNLVKLIEVFDDHDPMGVCRLVMELVPGGELFHRIVRQTALSEREARRLVRDLLSTVNYMHHCNVVHRDLKPENVLLVNEEHDTPIKVVDFGFAEHASDLATVDTACGTPHYVAPEILKGEPQSAKVDIWSLGIITYVLMGGYPPFYDGDRNILFGKIIKGQYEFHSAYWDHISSNAIDFIQQMLQTDPAERASASQLLRHPWILTPGHRQRDVMLLGAPWRGPLAARYSGVRKVRATLIVIIAIHLMRKSYRRRRFTDVGIPGSMHKRASSNKTHDTCPDSPLSYFATSVGSSSGGCSVQRANRTVGEEYQGEGVGIWGSESRTGSGQRDVISSIPSAKTESTISAPARAGASAGDKEGGAPFPVQSVTGRAYVSGILSDGSAGRHDAHRRTDGTECRGEFELDVEKEQEVEEGRYRQKGRSSTADNPSDQSSSRLSLSETQHSLGKWRHLLRCWRWSQLKWYVRWWMQRRSEKKRRQRHTRECNEAKAKSKRRPAKLTRSAGWELLDTRSSAAPKIKSRNFEIVGWRGAF